MPDFQCEVEEFAADVFKAIRLRDGVSEGQLGRSLQPEGNWMRAAEATESEFVFRTADANVALRVLTEEEAGLLVKQVLPVFPTLPLSSLLCSLYGLFSIRLPGTAKEHILLINNITQVPKPLLATFDLKGGRSPHKPPKRADPNALLNDSLRDMDFQLMIGKLSLSEEDMNRFTAGLFADVSLLHSLGLMDYSLQVGIGECRQEVKTIPRRFQRHVFKCTNAPNRVYVIGVQDYVHSFSRRRGKRSKPLALSPKDSPVLSPDAYGDRFLDMIREITE